MTPSPRVLLCAALLMPAPVPATAATVGEDAVSTRGFYLQLITQARIDGRARAALAYLDDFERRYPGDPEAAVLRVNSLLDIGDVDGAEAAAAGLPSAGGGDNRDKAVNAVHGHLLAARGRWHDALPFYQAAVRASPTEALLRNALGYAQLRAGLGGAAIETLRGAAALAPSDAVIRNNLLLALTMDGRQDEARAALQAIADPGQRSRLSRQIADEAARIAAQPPRSPRQENSR
ncbi:Flp pilus assembly protein TadD [Sphingobium jiangsuense]|uniref:Flp pilus assembly protein TadD n=2 Tax=Sphingobium jiangsuense TaxID=870476 RepID=A0A7W6BND0_9SPHN|nr:tetratricopeptide repeat protein [Sphingobium jiangsuense]MBB3927025.1 Flp pilus assembly protein TadD [Sphingobium jiangsuense]